MTLLRLKVQESLCLLVAGPQHDMFMQSGRFDSLSHDGKILPWCILSHTRKYVDVIAHLVRVHGETSPKEIPIIFNFVPEGYPHVVDKPIECPTPEVFSRDAAVKRLCRAQATQRKQQNFFCVESTTLL